MNDVTSISKKLWKLLFQLFVLLLQLGSQVVLPNRKRTGNFLNTLFHFYIGVIENLQHFEHRQLKMTDLFQHKFVRRGMMLLGFLLFFLASYEQQTAVPASFSEPSRVESVCQNTVAKADCACGIRKSSPLAVRFFTTGRQHKDCSRYTKPFFNNATLYLQNRRLLI